MILKLLLVFVFLLSPFCASCGGQKGQTKVVCELSFEYSEGQILGSVSYKNFSNYLVKSTLLLCLYPNREISKSGRITPLTVLVNKNKTPFELVGKFDEYLKIEANFKSGDEVSVQFKTNIEEGGARLFIKEDIVNLAYFYPQICALEGGDFAKYPHTLLGDPYFDLPADYNVKITLPSVMTVACGLTPLSVETLGEKTSYYYEIKNAKTVAFCLGQKYMVTSKKWGYKRVNYYYYNDEQPEKRLENIISYLQFFSSSIASYPHETLSVAQSEYHYGGMEYPAFCVVNSKISSDEYDYCILHEIAHQWFGVGVDFNQYKNAWLDEGLAECLSMLYLKEHNQGEYSQRLFYLKGICDAFDRAVSRGNFNYKEGVFRNLSEYSNEYEYVVCAYKKPALCFLNACESIGKKAFFKGLKRVCERYIGKNATLSQLLKCFTINQKTVQKHLPTGA